MYAEYGDVAQFLVIYIKEAHPADDWPMRVNPRLKFIKDPQNLRIQLTLNGKVMQDSNTAHMIHSVFELVHYASNVLTLQPGDVISTGSPAGVGFARSPPIFMKPGDVAVCSVEQVGILTNPVVAFTAPSASSQPSR